MKTSRRSFIVSVSSLMAVTALKASAQTPEPTPDPRMWGGKVIRTENATRITWGKTEPELPGVPGWVPLSLTTYVTTDGSVYFFAELKNVTGVPSIAPRLNIEALQGDFSFGLHEEAADTPWVDADSTAFYFGHNFFGSSLGNSDWDGIYLSTAAENYRPLAEYDFSGLVIEDGRLVNNTPNPVGPVYMYAFVRDSNGIFCGGCASQGTGANTPPNGGSIKLGSDTDPNHVPECGFTLAGMEASQELGVGAPFTSEYRLVGFE